MNRAGKKYRAVAVVASVFAHALVLVVARFVSIQTEAVAPEFITIEMLRRAEPARVAPRVERSQRSTPRRTRAGDVHAQPSPAPATLPPVQAPAVTPRQPDAISEREFIERVFFGDSLYTILREYPSLRPLALQQILTRGVPTKDSLETLRQQLAEALLPYINMSEPERQARANMKLFGTPTNPMRPGPIPGNIPISDLIMLLINLLK